MREKIDDSIYELIGTMSRGTGFVTTDGEGNKVMITNAHVCDEYEFMKARDIHGNKFTLKVLEKSGVTDLCKLQAPKNSVPLKLAKEFKPRNDIVFSAGYPLISYMSSTAGRAKGYGIITLPVEVKPEDCVQPKHTLRTFVKTVKTKDGLKTIKKQVCYVSITVVHTTMPIDAGASGSPTVNGLGEVVGVVTTSSGNLSWGSIVPHPQLKRFLKIK